MDRQQGMDILGRDGWLGAAPGDFREAILSGCGWQRLDAGAAIQSGGEEEGELIGLASGVIAARTVLGPPDTPIMHLIHPVFWIGYAPIVADRPRPIAASARTPIWIARIAQARVTALLAKRPEWHRQFVRLAITYGDAAVNVAADLLIRDSERRCAAVLLRLSGCRFAGQGDGAAVEVALTQNELAGAANLSRNSVGTMVQRLENRGLIDLGYRGVTIRAPAALRAFVDEG
jgi:CRP/FNR family cyclic AMP-dependent transcriptional regulator